MNVKHHVLAHNLVAVEFLDHAGHCLKTMIQSHETSVIAYHKGIYLCKNGNWSRIHNVPRESSFRFRKMIGNRFFFSNKCQLDMYELDDVTMNLRLTWQIYHHPGTLYPPLVYGLSNGNILVRSSSSFTDHMIVDAETGSILYVLDNQARNKFYNYGSHLVSNKLFLFGDEEIITIDCSVIPSVISRYERNFFYEQWFSMSKDCHRLFTLSRSHMMTCSSLSDNKTLWTRKLNGIRNLHAKINHDDTYLIIDQLEMFTIVSTFNGETLHQLYSPIKEEVWEYSSILFSPDSSKVIFGNRHMIYTWDLFSHTRLTLQSFLHRSRATTLMGQLLKKKLFVFL